MADIRNDQYLHRPGAGRGAITPADPFEVLLYDGSGNPLLMKKPTGETRQALGVAGYGYDGTNWRPVKVNASGQAEVQLTGSNLALRQTIVTGAKTVTSTTAEIFAGASRLSGRHAMIITNTGSNTVYIGASNVSASNGFPVFPQDTIRIEFDPQSSVAVFAVSNGPNVVIRVVELA